MLVALAATRLGMRSIVLTGTTEETKAAAMGLRARVRPGTTVVRIGDGAKWNWLMERNELLRSMDPKKVRVQICEGNVCKEVVDMSEVEKALKWDEEEDVAMRG